MSAPHRLKFTNRDNEVFYLVSISPPAWQKKKDGPVLCLINETTPDPAKARQFPTIAAAAETHEMCGEPDGWQIELISA